MNFSAALWQVWTIARQSVLQALRMKVAVVLIVFMMVMVPSLPFLLQSDNTHEGMLKMVITYSISLVTFLLGVLTLFLSSMTLNTEIKGQHIFLLDPKPLSRGTLLLGKWCGVMLINLVLLTVMMGATYGLVKYVGRRWKGETQQGNDVVQWEVLSARKVAQPPLPNLDKWVAQEVKYAVDHNEIPEGKSVTWYERTVQERLAKQAWTVPPHAVMKWTVSGLPTYNPKDAGALVIRFRHYSNADDPSFLLPGKFIINPGGQPYSTIEDSFMAGKPHSIGIPPNEVKPDGTLDISYENLYVPPHEDSPLEIRAAFPFEDGIQVLYPVATFGENMLRAGSVIFMLLAFIAIVGVWASTFLSFPVAVLLTLVVFTIGYMSQFIVNDLIGNLYLFGNAVTPIWSVQSPLDVVARDTLRVMFTIFPDFSKFAVVSDLSDGMLISLKTLFDCFFWLIFVRGGVLALTGWVIFRRRELAATSVSA